MKKILVIACLLSMSMWATAQDTIVIGNKAKQDMSLQKNSTKPINSGTVLIGDTVVINKACVRYLTGEKPSEWVYNVRHVIGQIGSERFPEGIYLENIRSWVAIEPLMTAPPVVPTSEYASEGASEGESEPIVGTNPAEPVNPAEPATPAEPAEPATPAEPVEPAIPAEPADSAQSAEPVEPAEVDTIANDSVATEELANDSIRVMDRFTIGVRGGAASMMQNLDGIGKGSIGFDVALDLQYAHYWKTKHEHNVGLLVGASAAFARNQVKGNASADFRLPTVDGDIDYHISGAVDKLVMNEIQVEVPVMFSLVTKKGFFLNLGPKLMVPVYSFYKQNLTASDITATFVKEGVPVTNEVVTGVFPADQKETKGKWHNAVIHVMLAGELGYEFKLKNNDSFGLGVYGGYSVYNNYKQLDQTQPSYVQITAPTATSCAIVNVKCASDVHMNRLGYWDAGLKLAYHFNWWKTKKK